MYTTWNTSDSIPKTILSDRQEVDDYLAPLGSIGLEEKRKALGKLISWKLPRFSGKENDGVTPSEPFRKHLE